MAFPDKSIIQQFDLGQPFGGEEPDYSIAAHYATALRHLESMSRQCMWIFDYYRNNFYYLSGNTDFFPQEDRQMVQEDGYHYFTRNTHPNDVLYLLTIHKTAWKFLNNLPSGQTLTDFKICYIIRLRNAKGKYVSVSQQVKAIATDASGNMWLSMGLFEEVSHELSYFPYIENTATGKRFELNEIARQKAGFEAPRLSEREMELLWLLGRNLTQREIADHMCVALDTFKTHRKSLYRKLHASGKNEALKNAYYLGLFSLPDKKKPDSPVGPSDGH